MKKKTTTIRIGIDVKERLDKIRGEVSCNKFIDYLLEFFLTKK